MAEWWRSWHGAPTDPKWRVIAKRAKAPTSAVVAVAWALFDRASQADDRGSVEGFDAEVIADFLDLEADEVERIIEAMRSKAILDGERVTSWDKRQPKREDNSTDRVKAYREREKAKRDGVIPPVSETDVTPCNAGETQCNSRGEERREEKRRVAAAEVVTETHARDDAAAPASPISEDFHDRVLIAAGIDASKDTSGRWFNSENQHWPRQWVADLGMTEAEVLAEIRAKAATMTRPPNGLKFFTGLMQEAAGRKSAPRLVPIDGAKPRASPEADRERRRAMYARAAEYSKPGA